jgi:predicted nucleic acid-binding protein
VLLVDSSVWVLVEHGRFDLDAATTDENVVTCPAIALEVLRGARHYDTARRVLLEAAMLDDPTPFERFEQAARLYRRCRDAGITIHSSIDCLVAATALTHNAVVFHDDRDYEHIRRVVPLRTVTRSSIAER